MAAGVTEVIVEKDQDETETNDTKKPEKKETKALQNGTNSKKSK